MRSRPSVVLRMSPSAPRPGQTFDVEATFVSRSETPVDWIDFRLAGAENVTQPDGRQSARTHREFLALAARHTPTILPVGKQVCRARFAIPAHVPASYRGRFASIDYTLAVHVSIPWWPDLRARYTVPVAMAPSGEISAQPMVFCSHEGGPRGTELYGEASLDSAVIEVGGVLTGAISFANTAYRNIRGVHVALVASERIGARWFEGTAESRRFTSSILAGAPEEGAAVRFQIRIPADAPPNYTASLSTLSWRLHVVVDTGWRKHAVLAVPITLVPASRTRGAAAPARVALPAVGRERRAQVWSRVAQRNGIAYDAEAESMIASVGSVGVTLAMEHRGGDGIATVATLSWPTLGVDLEVGPSQFGDAFSSDEIELGHKEFDRRWHVRGRVREQVAWILDFNFRQAVQGVAELRMNDEGATFAVLDPSVNESGLAPFVASTLAAARALDAAFTSLPAPSAIAAHVATWRAGAARIGGRFEIGRCWIHDATYGTERVEIGCLWRRGGEFDGTLARMALDPVLESAVDLDEPGSALSKSAVALIAELRRDARTMHVGPDAIEIERDAIVEDPARLEGTLDRMARLARAIHGREEVGPYR